MSLQISERVRSLAARAQSELREKFDRIDAIAEVNTQKVLAAFQKHHVAESYFAGTTGYGYDDLGRDKLEEIYADIFGTEDALVRIGFVNGTHAISCAVLLLALEQLQKSENDLYFVFTVQEEVGLRGAKTAAFAIDPAYAIAVDVTSADDELGSKHTATSKLGAGAAVKVMDRSVLCHPSMVRKLNALAKEQGIPVQGDIIKAGGTDAGAIHQSRAGVYTGGISIPCRYIHTPQEMVDLRDVEACAKLAAAFAGAALEG